MKKVPFSILFSVFALLLSGGCMKDANQKLLKPFISFTVNGSAVRIEPPENILQNSEFSCQLKGDSILIINTAKLYEGTGFYMDVRHGVNGTHILNHLSKGYYNNPKDFKRYTTDSLHTGSIAITRSTFQAKELLDIVEGSFAFTGVDPATGKKMTITDGAFKLELEMK